jgi:rhomboid protease GluP
MFGRQTSGSVVCVSCGYLVGVNDERCYHCGRRNPGLWGFAPALRQLGHDLGFVPFVTGTCIVVYVITLLWSGPRMMLNGGFFNFLAPDSCTTLRFGASGAIPVFAEGRWWTVLSANWLHGSILHILFNVLWIRQLAPEVGELYGPGRMVIIYTIAGVLGFTASSVAGAYLWFMPPLLRGAPETLGASAAIFGLLGALVYYGQRTGSRVVHSQAMSWALMLFLFGLLSAGVDNYAHAGGFAGGFFAARLLDPLKPERINHLALALGCLVLSVLSVIVSFVMPLPRQLPFCP